MVDDCFPPHSVESLPDRVPGAVWRSYQPTHCLVRFQSDAAVSQDLILQLLVSWYPWNHSPQESARARLVLERQLPESVSRLVVYQLVVPQLVVLRFPRCPLLWRLFSSSIARVLLNSAPSHSASIALRTCSLEHFSKHPRMEVRDDVRVGDTATTTPGPVQPLLPVKTSCCATPWSCLPH